MGPTAPLIRRLAPTPSSLKPFHLSVLDDSGHPIWIVRETGSRGPLWYTRLRGLTSLTLHAQGPTGQFWIRRPAGLVRYRYSVEGPDGRTVWQVRSPWFRWSITDSGGRSVASISFTNPTILGTDRAKLRTPGGLEVAHLEISPVVPFGSRWRGSMVLYSTSEEWETLAVTLASIRIAHKQMR